MDGLNLVNFAQQHPSLRRKIAVGSGLCAVLLAAEYHGYVSEAWRWLRRGLSTVVAGWLEEQGGFPLFTLEGEEPEVAKLSWDLPSMAAQGAADASRQLGGDGGPSKSGPAEMVSPASSSAAELPNFFASTKFFSCLDLKESQELFEASQMVTVAPHETLFEVGESGHPGIFIVVEGQLGVFIPQGEELKHSNTLRAGESCGDFDVLDGASRSVTCVALDEGAVLVQVSRELFMRFIAAKPRTLQIYLHKAMARLWRVGHFVLSDFLNLTLEQASSTQLSETPHLSSMAQLSMPDSTAQRPMRQATAQNELDQMRTSNGGKPRQPYPSPGDRSKPPARAAETAGASGREEDQREARQGGEASGSQAADTAGEPGIVQGGADDGSMGNKARGESPPSPASGSSSSEEAPPAEAQASKDVQRGKAAPKESVPAKLPVGPRVGDPRSSGAGRSQKMVKFHPSLAAVKESSSERRSTSRDSKAPFVQPSREASPKEEEEVTSGVPAKPRKSLLTEIIRKGDLKPSAVSPFASVSQQSSPTTSTLDMSPAPSSRSSLGDDLVRIGEELGDELLAKSEETEIASSIRNAMSHLRAGSLPAALVRPICPETDDSDVQGKSPDARSEVEAAMESRAQSSNSMRSAGQACLAMGWDVISPEECCLSSRLWRKLCMEAGKKGAGQRVDLRRGEVLHIKDQPCRRFQIVLEGRLLAERKGREGQQESVQITPGSLIGCAAFLSSSRNRETIRVSQTSSLAMFGPQELDALMKRASDCFVELLLAAARALGPVIRRFISLGLNRVWLDAGNAAYRQGENASCLYIIISGRLRLVREDPHARPPVRVEEEVGRGEAVGAVWALAGGYHDTSALCIRDAELVRMSRGAFELIVAQCPMAVAGMLSGMGRRLAAASAIRNYGSKYDPTGRAAVATPVPATSKLNGAAGGGSAKRGEVVTICLVPAGCKPGRGMECAEGSASAIKKLGEALRHTLEELFGPTLHLSSASMELMFPTSFHRLSSIFYRSKVTSWMAAQEEDYRFILMEADTIVSAWTRICVSQADCLLLVGAEGSVAPVNEIEHHLIWEAMGPLLKKDSLGMMTNKLAEGLPSHTSQGYVDAKLYAARMRRVELVLLHSQDTEPKGTIHWLNARPHLARHHHARISHPKDMARLARWMAGKAVGLVLSGGGSRGLAHLGVLHALDDAGVPVDVIGGTSQGAFMAGLYAQGLTWEQMHKTVRSYATQMGSVRHLIWDLTLPIISVFNGHGFDRVIRDSFSDGPQQIEDLWLSYFCISTNLSQGEPSVHQRGLLWKLVRASMTIVGLVPPVYYQGDLLVDGGYLNNIPVDVMRGSLGVDTVIVVDVEDKDASVWRNLTSYEGGISGWRLLWDRWCPIPSLRFGFKIPRYQQIINHLTWMSHSQNLKRVSQEHVIDLYLQPPVGKFRLMDFNHLERLVRDANRYAFGAIAEWQCRQGVSQQGMAGTRPLKETAKLRMRRAHSIPCMTQLQIKHSDAYSGEASEDQDPHRAETLRVPDSTAASDALSHMLAAGDSHSTSNWPSGSAGDAKPSGLFQIVGPMAFPSANDLNALEEGPATQASIQSLPSRRLAGSTPRLSMLAGDFGGRRPSLEAQLRPIDSKTARAWLPSASKSRLGKEEELPDINDFPVVTPQLSTSAPPAPAAPWVGDIGEGTLALPNQGILPEDSRPTRILPEVRRPSFRAHRPAELGEDARAIEGLTSRPAFRDKS